jgi:sec-independent protein translocase protein TatC
VGQADNLRRRRLNFIRRRRRKSQDAAMTVIEHLDELRSRLIKSLVAFLLLSVFAFAFFRPISDFLLDPLCDLDPDKLGPQGCRLIAVGPLEPFLVRLKVTAMVALVCSAPIWLYQVWAFVTPGLTLREKRYAGPFIGTSIFLFGLGTFFAYITLPAALNLLIGLGGGNVVPFFRANDYLNFVGLILLAFGLSFLLPLVLFFLGLAGVVTRDSLRRHRRHAMVVIALLSAIITPSQDPYTMLAMALPLYLFYEVVIFLLRFVERRRAREEVEAT